jgi:Protein of unknown function (DUF1360)
MTPATETPIRQPPESATVPEIPVPDGGSDEEGFRGPGRQLAYAALTAFHGAALATFIAWRERSGRDLPERIGLADVVLLGLATQRTSRAIAKDKVTAPLRAPLTSHEGTDGAAPGEVEESPKGKGFRYALGELVLCPFCLAQWVAAGFAAGLVAAPRVTRFLVSLMAAVGVADFLQVGYKAAEERMSS